MNAKQQIGVSNALDKVRAQLAAKQKVLAASDAPVTAGVPVEPSQTTAQPSQVQVELQEPQALSIELDKTPEASLGATLRPKDAINTEGIGVRIKEVNEGELAQKAGLRAGDVLVAVMEKQSGEHKLTLHFEQP